MIKLDLLYIFVYLSIINIISKYINNDTVEICDKSIFPKIEILFKHWKCLCKELLMKNSLGIDTKMHYP